MEKNNKHLELTVADLAPAYKNKVPDRPRFYHFLVKAADFQEAETIVFKQEGKPDYVIKDTYGKYEK